MNETTMTVAGNLVSDVDYRVTAKGDALARFRIACTAKRYDRASGSWLDGDTSYWNVTAWRRAAENARESLAKGFPVVVHGKVRQRTVDRPVADAPGVTMPVTFTDIEAVHFGLDLTRCQSVFRRAPIGPQTASTGGPEEEGSPINDQAARSGQARWVAPLEDAAAPLASGQMPDAGHVGAALGVSGLDDAA